MDPRYLATQTLVVRVGGRENRIVYAGQEIPAELLALYNEQAGTDVQERPGLVIGGAQKAAPPSEAEKDVRRAPVKRAPKKPA